MLEQLDLAKGGAIRGAENVQTELTGCDGVELLLEILPELRAGKDGLPGIAVAILELELLDELELEPPSQAMPMQSSPAMAAD